MQTNLATAPRQVQAMKGQQITSVSSQWWNRPDDERFTSLDELAAAVGRRADTSTELPTALEDTVFDVDDLGNVRMEADGRPMPLNNWSFGQVCRQIGAPSDYLRRLPPEIAAINLETSAKLRPSGQMMAYLRHDPHNPGGAIDEVRAVTSTSYGRITDHEVVKAVQRVADGGPWKVPGEMRSFGTYNPVVDVTKENTTLYASDRDVFMFLVDDLNPIEVAPGDPMFRGFYVWNSETGSRSFGIATMYLRAVCCNRILWGVEHFNEIKLHHTANAPARFYEEAGPSLESFTASDPSRLVSGVTAARKAIAARKEDEQVEFLTDLNFSRKAAEAIVKTHEAEEGRRPESVWDMAQGITAFARSIKHQDDRIATERVAGKLLSQVTIDA